MKYCEVCKKPFIEIERELNLGIERSKCPFCEPYFVATTPPKIDSVPISRKNNPFTKQELKDLRQDYKTGRYSLRALGRKYKRSASTIWLWVGTKQRRTKRYSYGKL